MTPRFSVRRIGGPLASATGNAKARWSERWSLEIRIEDEQGVGLGEAAPLPGYSAESPSDVRNAVQALLPIEDWDQALEAVPAHLPSLRFALETAIRDLRGQQGAFQPVPRCSLVDIDGRVEDADAPALKLKVGADWARESERIRTLRAQVPDVALRIDGNQSWTARELGERYDELRALDLELVEELVPSSELSLLNDLDLPYALDESLREPDRHELIRRLLQGRRIKALVLKPTTLGGLAPCQDWAAVAFAHGAHAIASHCFEGPIGSAAVAELASWLVERGESLAMGIAPHACSCAYLEERP